MNRIIFLICLFCLPACTQQKKPISNKSLEKKVAIEATTAQTAPSEQASIEDTFKRKGTGSAYVFFVSKINDRPTKYNAVTESRKASVNQGIYLNALGASRDIAIEPLKVSLIAQVIHAAPIVYLADPDAKLKLEGDVEFTPTSNMKYFVKGILSKDQASIWIEDINGNVVSKPIGELPSKTTNMSSPISSATFFANISNGESLSSVIRKLGRPDNISEYKTPLFVGPPAHDFTTYEYKALGKIQFFGIHPNIRTVEKIMAGAQIGNTPASLKEKIDATPPAELRLIAKDYYMADTPDISYLDVLAEKIWVERNSEDGKMIDAVAYFCLALGKSKNARYRELLQSVINSSKSRKVQKHAKQNLDLLTTDRTPQFKPSAL